MTHQHVMGWTLLVNLMLVVSAAAQVESLAPAEQEAIAARLPLRAQAAEPQPLRQFLRQAQADRSTAAQATAVRVAEDVAELKPAGQVRLIHYAVPALSPLMRLPETYPIDGRCGGELRVIAARDEYEPTSFLLYAFDELPAVELVVSDLQGPGGAVLSRDRLDLKVVKVWYQNGNSWYSYFSDVGLQLVPELLLKDENLIRVDTQRGANYARLHDGPDGLREVWISAPRELDRVFDHYDPRFADAPTLQPVRLKAGEFKQFLLTIHIPADVPAGVYRGRIDVRDAQQELYRIPLLLRVLPFTLPLPKTRFDPDQDLLVSLMHAWPRLPVDHPAFMPTLRNLRAHNLLHTGPGLNPDGGPEEVEEMVCPMVDAGFQTRPIVSRHALPSLGAQDATPFTFDQLMRIRRAAERWREFYLRRFGHTDVYLGYGDEPTPQWVMKARRLWRVVHEQGLKVQIAGHEHLFTKAGYILDYRQAGAAPTDEEQAKHRRALGHGYISFYANQHTGVENPDFVRRQHGLLTYLAGYSAIHNYAFYYGPWNDLALELYKPMVLAYPISHGLIDTLAWEGFREAVDDIRYATLLNQLARTAIASGQLDRVYAGRKTLQWMELMDGTRSDLDAVRLEMIDRMLQLTRMQEAQ